MIEEWQIELLLNIDSTWRTRSELCKHSNTLRLMSHHKMVKLMTKLVNSGLLEKRKVSNKRIEYRRVFDFPTHEGCQA